MFVLLDEELLALDPTDLLGVKSEYLVARSLNVFVVFAAVGIILEVLDFGRARDHEGVVALLVLKDEVAGGGRGVDRVVLRLVELLNVENNQLVVVVVRLLLVDEHKEVHLLRRLRLVLRDAHVNVAVEALYALLLEVTLVLYVHNRRVFWELEAFDVLEFNPLDGMIALQE